jgi:hypothetical protein
MGQIAKAELIIFGFYDYCGYGTYSNLHSRNHLCKTQLAKDVISIFILYLYVQSPKTAGFTPACLSAYENTVSWQILSNPREF